jgi:hypothetical protein
MLRNSYGRRLLYSVGYRDALLKFERDYAALIDELEELRHQVRELRVLAGLRDPSQPLQ